jgi:hypothetical protein
VRDPCLTFRSQQVCFLFLQLFWPVGRSFRLVRARTVHAWLFISMVGAGVHVVGSQTGGPENHLGGFSSGRDGPVACIVVRVRLDTSSSFQMSSLVQTRKTQYY